MQKHAAIIAVLGGLAVLYAWAGPGPKSAAATWEYKQITTQHRSLLSPAIDADGRFDKKANDELTEGIAYANKLFDKHFQDELRQAGRDGWELVSVTSTSSNLINVKDADTTAYLKRPAR
jgi:hypothetical protein